MPRYVALLRAITNVKMDRFRAGLEALGFTDVASFGMSGNLFFTARASDRAGLERRITAKLGAQAFVRTLAQIERAAKVNPFRGEAGASVLFLAQAPLRGRRDALAALDVAASRPLLLGDILFYVHPTTLRGRRTPIDFERTLDVPGTARSARVLDGLARRPR